MLGLVRRRLQKEKGRMREGQLPGAGGTRPPHPHPPAPDAESGLLSKPLQLFHL